MSDKVSAGDRFAPRAADWNTLLDVAASFRNRSLPDGPLVPGAGPAVRVRVRNSTGAARAAGDVLALGGSLVSVANHPGAAAADPIFDGTTPAGTAVPVAVLTGPVPDGRVGEGVVAGVWLAKVNVTNTGHKYAAPTASQVYLTSSNTFGPVALLGTPGATGTQVFPVLVGWLPPTSLVTVLTDVECVDGVLTLTTQQVRVLDP